MNKITKWIISILVCVSMFFCGFFISNKQILQNTTDYSTQATNTSADFSEDTNKDYIPNLTEAEITFLEEHLFGQWRFSERLFELDESKNIVYNTTYNISDSGVEELKKNIVLRYDKDWIQFAVPVTQNSFKNAKDMFLFGKNGGFLSIKEPVYTINKMDSDTINLSNVCIDDQGYDIQFFDAENFINVKYYSQLEKGEYTQRKVGKDFANTIYIDHNNKNIIYVDFCGLWRMERDDTYYGTGGKSER